MLARYALMCSNMLARCSRISAVAFSPPARAQRASPLGFVLLTKSHLVLLVWESLFLNSDIDSLPHSCSSRSFLFPSFPSFFLSPIQLHTWLSLALTRTTPLWLALDRTSVNILLFTFCPPLLFLKPHSGYLAPLVSSSAAQRRDR